MNTQATLDGQSRWYVFTAERGRLVTWAKSMKEAAVKASEKGYTVAKVEPAGGLGEASRQVHNGCPPATVNVTRTPQSSWIRGVGYRNGILIILTGPEGSRKTTGAMLYSGVPSWIVGLLVAAQAKAKTGESAGQESVGATYRRLVKGRYPRQTIGPERIDELRKLIGGLR